MILVGGVAVALALECGGAALGADIPMPVKAAPVAAPSWAGCYAGLQLGGAQSDARWNYKNNNPYDSVDPALPLLVTDQTFRQLRFAGGAQAGCNMSYSGPWMLGMELGWIATPEDKTESTGINPVAAPGFTGSVRTDIKSILSVTGRVGYSFMPDWLVYAKAGFAAAYIELRGNITPGGGSENLTWNDSNWHSGWTAGAGVEYRLFRNVTIGAEYNYYRFGMENYSSGVLSGVPAANQVQLKADADVHTVMARLNFYDPSSPVARAVSANSGGPTGEFSSFLTNSVKYASWYGSRGPNVFAPDRGKGDQVYSPVSAGIDYVEPNSYKLELRGKGGYVYSRQATAGQNAVYEGPVDTQTSVNVVLLSFESVRPQFGVAMNLPTGTSYLPNNQRFTRMDPDLVEVGAYGAGFNINPTAGFVMGINKDTAVSFSAGYAWNGKFVREGVDLNAGNGFGTGAFDLKQHVDPADVFTANANITTQIDNLTLLGSFAYMSEGNTTIDGVNSGKTGARFNANVSATWQLTKQAALTTNTSWSFAEKNDIILPGGGIGTEPSNSNSNVVIGSIEPSYMLTEQLRLAVNYSFLWRDANFYDQIQAQFVPAKQKHTAGMSATYAISPTASIEARGSYSFVHQEDSAILPTSLGPPVVSSAQPPSLDYRAWAVSTTANLRF
jgi:opacity protein-like surface antigen